MAFAALKVLQGAGCDFADVYLEETLAGRVKMEAGRVDQLTQGGEFGAGLRLVRGEQTVFASTNDVSPAGLSAAARALVSAAGPGKISPETKGLSFFRSHLPGIELPGTVTWPERIQAAREAEAAARAAGAHIRQVTVFLGWNQQHIGIARSDGAWCEDARAQVVLWVNAVAGQGEKLQTGFESSGGSQGWETIREHGAVSTGRLAGERAQRLLTARPAPAGRGCVVLAAEAGGTMIHEAVGHALEADLVQKELSPYGNQLGQKVASPLISVADDATLAGWRGSFGCDDEGTPAQCTLLIDQGILKGFLHDRLTARQGGVSPTGNGRRQSYAHRPIPRMTNTMILPGREDAQAVIRSVPHGLYVVRMGGGQVNTVNGDFVFEINEAYLIENGVVTEPVLGTTMIGNAAEVLQSIDHVASDFGRGLGTCGKDGQGVPVADAQPTLRIPEITIGG
ncbi:MAG: TldD/PmbA family protein [Candidatus Firestonebacteria bacterium]|nr:TldD/PmbA family protein [Candidatus Firestonebacteria bacterium]